MKSIFSHSKKPLKMQNQILCDSLENSYLSFISYFTVIDKYYEYYYCRILYMTLTS